MVLHERDAKHKHRKGATKQKKEVREAARAAKEKKKVKQTKKNKQHQAASLASSSASARRRRNVATRQASLSQSHHTPAAAATPGRRRSRQNASGNNNQQQQQQQHPPHDESPSPSHPLGNVNATGGASVDASARKSPPRTTIPRRLSPRTREGTTADDGSPPARKRARTGADVRAAAVTPDGPPHTATVDQANTSTIEEAFVDAGAEFTCQPSACKLPHEDFQERVNRLLHDQIAFGNSFSATNLAGRGARSIVKPC
jgi:hypothetical protein